MQLEKSNKKSYFNFKKHKGPPTMANKSNTILKA